MSVQESPDSRHGIETTNLANSAIKVTRDQRAIVELDPDHPGFRDFEYRSRRNQIAQIALDYIPGSSVPDAPYIQAEHKAWANVCDHLKPAHEAYACSSFHEASKLIALSKDRLPQLREVSERLQRLSGFRLEPAGGLVDPRVFLETLGDGIFLSTQYIRHPSTPLYTPEPDIVHELIGHASTLGNPRLATINRIIGAAAQRAKTDEEIERIGRIYWFTIEFGVVKENGKPKAYGAGLLSSAGELNRLPEVELRPFDLSEMEKTDFQVTEFQPFLFCADDFNSMIEQIQSHLLTWPEPLQA